MKIGRTLVILEFYITGVGSLNYYRGPHELCIIAGEPQNQLILS